MKTFIKLGLLSILALVVALPISAKTTAKSSTSKVSTSVSKKNEAKKNFKKTDVVATKKSATKVIAKSSVAKKHAKTKTLARAKSVSVARKPVYRATRTSYGRQYGLDQAYDPLALRASVALVVDQNSWTTQYEKNSRQQLPVASITKLMTAMVVLDAGLDLNETLLITSEEAAHYGSSRLSVGTQLSRRDAILLALMSSENRAAYVLGRTYPGGLGAFVQAMNVKAAMLGMVGASFVDPSGLSSGNQATAMDLAKMVNAASQYKIIRQFSTSESSVIYSGSGRQLVYNNSNRLISRNMGWNIGMQKTGTLSAAGKCVVVQAFIGGAPKIIILLDSSSADSRVADAVRIKNWLESGEASVISKNNYSTTLTRAL